MDMEVFGYIIWLKRALVCLEFFENTRNVKAIFEKINGSFAMRTLKVREKISLHLL